MQFVAITGLLLLGGSAKAQDWNYQFQPIVDNGNTSISVRVAFSGSSSGKTLIVLPNTVAGETGLGDGVQALRVEGSGVQITPGPQPHLKVVSHPPGHRVRLAYDLREDLAKQTDSGYRPFVRKNFFHWLGSAGLVLPTGEQPVSFTFDWRLPSGWSCANSFGLGARQKVRLQPQALGSSVFVGGDFRVVQTKVKGYPVTAAIRGDWSFKDEEFAGLLNRVTSNLRSFWDDFEYPHYLVTLLPIQAPPNSMVLGGTGLQNSFATFCTTNAQLGDFHYLLTHELFHHWNPQQMGRFAQPEQQLYWFSEGFTDYFTQMLLFRAKMIDRQELVSRYNGVLRDVRRSPVGAAPNSVIVERFFSDPNVQRLPYWRGFLIASRWDTLLRRSTGGKRGLEDFMRHLRARWKSGDRTPLSPTSIAERFKEFSGLDVAEDVERYIIAGEHFLPERDALGPDAVLEEVATEEFELGTNLEVLVKDKRISDVTPGSAAARAGLRDGQAVVRRSPIKMNDPNQELEFVVIEDGAEKTVRYRPSRPGKESIWQFRLTNKT